jgi:hypothetical protein
LNLNLNIIKFTFNKFVMMKRIGGQKDRKLNGFFPLRDGIKPTLMVPLKETLVHWVVEES